MQARAEAERDERERKNERGEELAHLLARSLDLGAAGEVVDQEPGAENEDAERHGVEGETLGAQPAEQEAVGAIVEERRSDRAPGLEPLERLAFGDRVQQRVVDDRSAVAVADHVVVGARLVVAFQLVEKRPARRAAPRLTVGAEVPMEGNDLDAARIEVEPLAELAQERAAPLPPALA